jgi:hypothetical protein
MVGAGPVTLGVAAVLQRKILPAAPVRPHFTVEVDGAKVDTSVTETVLVGATTEAMIRAAPILRIGITLGGETIFQGKRGPAMAVGPIEASALEQRQRS